MNLLVPWAGGPLGNSQRQARQAMEVVCSLEQVKQTYVNNWYMEGPPINYKHMGVS